MSVETISQTSTLSTVIFLDMVASPLIHEALTKLDHIQTTTLDQPHSLAASLDSYDIAILNTEPADETLITMVKDRHVPCLVIVSNNEEGVQALHQGADDYLLRDASNDLAHMLIRLDIHMRRHNEIIVESNNTLRLQAVLARLERDFQIFTSLETFFPHLAEKLLSERSLPVHVLTLSKLQANSATKSRFFAQTLFQDEHHIRETQRLVLDALDQRSDIIQQVTQSGEASYLSDLSQSDWKQLQHLTQLKALACFPINQGNRVWGVMTLFSKTSEAFSWQVKAFFTEVIEGLELALKRKAENERMSEQVHKMHALLAATEALRSGSSAYDIYQNAIAGIIKLTSATDAQVLRLEQGQLILVASFSDDKSLQEVRLSYWNKQDKASKSQPWLDSSANDVVAIPIHDQHHNMIGLLVASIDQDLSFSNEDLNYIEAIAHASGSALVRLELLEAQKREAKAYRSLAIFGSSIEEVNDVDKLMALGLQSLRQQLQLDMATYHEVKDGYLYPMKLWGHYPQELMPLRNSKPKAMGEGLTGYVAEAGEMIYIEDYREWQYALPAYVALGLATQVVIPVKQNDKVVKVLSISGFNKVTYLSDEQLTITKNFVKRLENALERADHITEIEATREATLRSLGLVLEHRDVETAGHTDRVVALSLRLGTQLQFDARQIQALRWGAYLHDIGKVAIPDRVLFKPDRLSNKEFETIKTHTVVGHEMCRDIPFLPTDTISLVRSHHERWDGGGYPDGLRAERIPKLARLFTIVDFYDALVSERPYKAAWSHEHTINEIETRAGEHFDPELARLFVTSFHTN